MHRGFLRRPHARHESAAIASAEADGDRSLQADAATSLVASRSCRHRHRITGVTLLLAPVLDDLRLDRVALVLEVKNAGSETETAVILKRIDWRYLLAPLQVGQDGFSVAHLALQCSSVHSDT